MRRMPSRIVPAAGDRWIARLTPLVLAAFVLIAHGGSLRDGLFFDDYWHRHQLRTLGWSWNDHVEAATFNLPGELAHLWWQEQPLQWRYARPVAMLAMKLEYALAAGNPIVIHAFGLAWLWGAALLVRQLAFAFLGDTRLALFAAAAFILHPHHVFAVSWIAARNALVSGAFFAAAIVAYLAASNASQGAARRAAWTAASLACAALALFSRETAIIFPAVVLLLDAGAGGWTRVRDRWAVYVALGALALVYLYWRLVVFPQSGPPEIYFSPPTGLAYFAWALGRLVHLLFAAIVQTPMFVGLSGGGGAPSAGTLGVYAILALAVSASGVWYAWASRGLALRWVWPAWLALAFVPVIPVFVMPHFSYLPAVALAVMLAALLRPTRGGARIALALAITAGSLFSLTAYRFAWRSIVRCEQTLYADVLAQAPKPPRPTRLFLIDFPIAGIYAAPALRDAWGTPDVEAHFLTFAPHPLAMRHRSEIERLSDFELRIRTEPPGWFAGLSGAMLLDGMRGGRRFMIGDRIAGDVFDVTIEQADARGVTALHVRFHEPIDSPGHLFFVSTTDRPAVRLTWNQSAHLPADVQARFALARDGPTATAPAHGDDVHEAMAARKWLARESRRAAWLLADPLARELAGFDALDPQHLDRVEAWWRDRDVARLLRIDEQQRAAQSEALAEREHYFIIMDFIARIIRSDVYLTGDSP